MSASHLLFLKNLRNMANELLKKSMIMADSLIGEGIKFYCRTLGSMPRCGVYLGPRKERVVVSLTSYGRRVKAALPFTIMSLLRQTYKPDAIVLWLDSDNWNEGNIPPVLKRMRSAGLTIAFCDDMRSYKKFVPSLEAYPDSLIVTVDDDFYYAADFIERLVRAYEAAPCMIHTHRAHRPTFAADGSLRPYNEWEKLVAGTCKEPIFATTGGGCLFRKSMLYADITNRSLFTELCPMADDVWFYFMSVLKKTHTSVLPKRPFTMVPLDNFYQLTHNHANLASVNCGESFNDVQIRNTMDYYGITTADLMLR